MAAAASLHLDAEPRPLILEDHGDRVDDTDVLVGFAIYDDLVLEPGSARNVEEVLLAETVVPAAVSEHQFVGVFLPGVGLRAGQLLHV